MVRVVTNGLGDWGLIRGWVIPKTQKMVLDASLLNTWHHKAQIKGKWGEMQEKGVVLFPTPWCSSYLKGSLQVVQLTFLQLIYMHTHTHTISHNVSYCMFVWSTFPLNVCCFFFFFFCFVFCHSNFHYNNYEMIIKILHYFLNKSINIIMDCCYNRNPEYLV